jgi:acyl carrier protein
MLNINIIKMKQKIISILTEIRPEFDFAQGTDFIENGMLDSFDVITLVTALDETFGISIDGVDILPENFSTIERIVALLKKNNVE